MSRSTKQYQYDHARGNDLLSKIRVSALVRVVSFNKDNMTVDVKPLSERLVKGEYMLPSLIMQVPISGISAGELLILPEYKKDDIGAIVYLDHDLDIVFSRGEESRPNTERSHSDSDAYFVGGFSLGNWKRPEGVPEGYVISSKDGATYLAVNQSGIHIKGNVSIEGEVTANGIALSKHTHSGVESGKENTGLPQ